MAAKLNSGRLVTSSYSPDRFKFKDFVPRFDFR